MNQINVYFETSEYEELIKSKGQKTWHDFILDSCLKEESSDGSE